MTPPNILPILDGLRNSYQLAGDWWFLAGVHLVKVPAGFICDAASVPRLLRVIYTPDGLHRAAAVAHDWLYANRGRIVTTGGITWLLTRKECDDVFYEVMLLSKVRKSKAIAMWLGVRSGGWVAWGRSAGIARVEPLHYLIT